MQPGAELQPVGHGEYSLLAPSRKAHMRVAADPRYFEENASRVEFSSPGNPPFSTPQFVLSSDHTKDIKTSKDILDA